MEGTDCHHGADITENEEWVTRTIQLKKEEEARAEGAEEHVRWASSSFWPWARRLSVNAPLAKDVRALDDGIALHDNASPSLLYCHPILLQY